jgi:hypothetical protein
MVKVIMDSFPDNFNAAAILSEKERKLSQEELMRNARMEIYDSALASKEHFIDIKLSADMEYDNRLKLYNELDGKFKLEVLALSDTVGAYVGIKLGSQEFEMIRIKLKDYEWEKEYVVDEQYRIPAFSYVPFKL